jgi:3-oxoacyl-[acyl-carrier protein] reductase
MELEGKTAMVTGASGDIGRSIAEALAVAGCDIAITYVGDRQRAEATATAVEASGRKASIIRLDQRDEDSISAAAEAVVDAHGRCDVLVNNAGWNVGISFPDLEQLDSHTWDRLLETNLRGPYLLARALAPILQRDGSGRIINIASVGGLYPGSSSIAYSCSKAGLIHLTHCLAVAMAPSVTVNCVAPGLVEGTRMAQRLTPEMADLARGMTVLGQVGSASDIADATVMLCRAETITGQTIVVDGGSPPVMNFG